MTTRRTLLAAAAAFLLPLARVRAQAPTEGAIRIGVLVPLTGTGGPHGSSAAGVARAVAAEVNSRGGVLGRPVEIVAADDTGDPEAGVRAARRLIDTDRVVAICGTEAPATATAVAPLCWQSGTMLLTASGADGLILLPHDGYVVRTQPGTALQGRRLGEFLAELGARRVCVLAPQNPSAPDQLTAVRDTLARSGGTAELVAYDDRRPGLRTEVDAALRFRPDAILAGGHVPDTAVLLRELARASFGGRVLGLAGAVNARLLEALPAEVVEGVYALSPAPAANSPAFARVQAITGQDSPDPYACQVFDQVTLAMLAMEAAKEVSGTAIRNTLRTVSQGGGRTVASYIEGVRALGAGDKIDYDGASGPCDFTDAGDLEGVRFRYEQVRAGRLVTLKVA